MTVDKINATMDTVTRERRDMETSIQELVEEYQVAGSEMVESIARITGKTEDDVIAIMQRNHVLTEVDVESSEYEQNIINCVAELNN